MGTLPKDSEGTPIPALALRDGGAHHINFTATAGRNTTAFASQKGNFASGSVVGICVTQPCYMKFGDSSVVATAADHYFPANVYYDFALKEGMTHCSFLRVTADGVAHISEKY